MEKKNNIPKAFIGFLIASVLIWFLINLSKEYETSLKYVVGYQELAQDRILQEEPTEEINVLVKGSGFKLFLANFSEKKVTFKTDRLSKKSKNDYYFLTNQQRVEIQKQLKSGLRLVQILQDTIHLKIGSLASKKVPVLLDVDIRYEVGYNKIDMIKVTPDSILISGPELQLKEIKNVQTSRLELDAVSKNIHKNINLKQPVGNKIKISTSVVKVDVFVDKFTEGELEVPVIVENLPPEALLNIYPKKVKVIYKVGLKNFNKVSVKSFKVSCDYQQSINNELTYLIPKVMQKPSFVSSLRIEPEKVDFLIHK